ncbi:MAG: tetratricopeptide repeat protein, partial [Kofleriaceae bacterium]|nr:tetratricopeptide repeat protein [Kofleriaceae bacterium]
ADTYNSGKFSSDALPMVAPMSVRSPSSPGVPNAGIPSPGAPNAGIPGPSVPNAGIPSQSVPSAGIPSPSFPNAGIPSAGAPNAGYPNPIVPNAGIPSAGAPNAGYPNPIVTSHPGQPMAGAPLAAKRGNRLATIGTLFPDDEVESATFVGTSPSGPSLPGGPSAGRLATIGTLFPDDESGVEVQVGRPATIGTLFPDTPAPRREPTVGDLVDAEAAGANPRPNTAESMVSRARSSDMDLIRGAVEPNAPIPVRRPRPAVDTAPAPAPAPKKGRTFPKAAWVAIALAVSAGGAFGGLQLRKVKLARQVQQVQQNAQNFAKSASYIGFRKARDLYGRIALVLPSDDALAALARSQALLVAEYGEDAVAAKATLARVGDTSLLDARIASTYLAIAAGNDGVAVQEAKRLAKEYPAEPIVHYLLGVGYILRDNGPEAVTAIEKSIELGPEALYYVALARAQAIAGRYSEALSTLARATASDGVALPSAVIWQAQILLESGNLPQNPSDPDDTLAQLGAASRNSQDLLSRGQGAWAGLVLAKIKLARGDNRAAQKALAEAKIGRPSDLMFSEMLMDVLLDSGDLAAAKEEALSAQRQWPDRMKPHIVSADVSLRLGAPDDAMELLLEIDGVENSAAGLALRGRVFLAQGEMERAVADLDKALGMHPQHILATLARAKVDLLRGDARAAIGRLAPLHDARKASALAVAYAEALRESGDIDKAREVLRAQSGGAPNANVLVGLAEIESVTGNASEAVSIFQQAIALAPKSENARLGAALLEIEQGRVQSGKEALESMLRDGISSGPVFVEAARVRIITGDLDGASELLLRTESGAGWLNWRVARARGRMLLYRQKPVEAVAELQRAQSLRPEDMETRVLLMEAYFEFRNDRGSNRALEDITKSFRRSYLRHLASGIHFLLQEDATSAVASLHEARTILRKEKASPLELSRVAYWLGRAYYNSDDLAHAEQWLIKATKLNSAFSSAHYWLGQVQHLEQKTAAMVASYETSVAINPSRNPLAWFFLGGHYVTTNKNQAAVSALESFLRYYPEESGDVVVEAKTLLAQVR